MSPEPESARREPEPGSELGSGDRGVFLLLLVLVSAMLAVMAAPILAGRLYLQTDLAELYLPLRHFYAQCLVAGDPPWWCPDLFSGFYLHAEGEACMAHPRNFFLYRFLPVDLAFHLEILSSYPFALLGTYLFLRRFRIARAPALFGAFHFGFSGFALMHMCHPTGVAVVAHLPWLLFATHVLFTDETPRGRAGARLGLSLFTTSQILLGYPQYFWISALAEAAFALWMARTTRSWRPLIDWTFFKVLGIVAGAVQLLPTLDAIGTSSRADPTEEYRNNCSLKPVNMLQLVQPYFFVFRAFGDAYPHEFFLYDGALASAAILWTMLRWRHVTFLTPLVRATSCFALFALVMAAGKYGFLYWIQAHLPVVHVFRCPCRYLLLFQLGASILVAAMMTDVWTLARTPEATDRRTSIRLWRLPLASVVAALLCWHKLAVSYPGPKHVDVGGAMELALGVVVMVLTVWCLRLALEGARRGLHGLILLMFLDQVFAGLRYNGLGDTLERFRRLYPSPATPHRLASQHNFLILAGNRITGGYCGMKPRHVLPGDDPVALRVAGVEMQEIPGELAFDGTPREPLRWRSLGPPLPRFRLAGIAQASGDPARDLHHIDPATTVLVPEDVPGVRPGPGTVQILSDRPGRIALKVSCTTRQILVVSESHHPGWRARVAGNERPVLPAYGDFLAIPVEPGDTRVDLSFEPASLTRGLRLTGTALVVLLAAVILGAMRDRRRSRAPGDA